MLPPAQDEEFFPVSSAHKTLHKSKAEKKGGKRFITQVLRKVLWFHLALREFT